MKFNILQQDLLPALSAVSRSCGFRSQLPVLANILIHTDQGRVKLSTTNLEVGVVKVIKAEVSEEGEITIPAKTLVEMVSNLAGEKIEFSSAGEHLEVSTPSFSSKINGITASEFPTIPLLGKEAASLNPQMLLKTLPQVTFAAAVDEGRPVLTGILTQIREKKVEFVATDGYRLAHRTLIVEEDSSFKALIPRRTLEEVARLISEEESDQVKISLSEDQNQIIFTLGNTQLSSRLIEGQFPSWEKIIPTEVKARVVVDRNEFLKAVKLASVFAKTEANIIKMENQPTSLVLTSEAKELGGQKKEIAAESSGESINIAFNAKFLQDILAVLNSSQIVIELSGNLSAAVLRPLGEDGLEYIIMPVNLS